MLKKFKMLVEFVSEKDTEDGFIGLKENGLLIKGVSELAKKNKMNCYVKGQPAEKINYTPTGKIYQIKTIEDISKLSPIQFEFFIDDLRNFCEIRRQINNFNNLIGIDIIENKEEGITWLDSGLNESKITFETTNKL